MKLSASVYAVKDKPLIDVVNVLTVHGVDMLHMDCNDTPSTIDDIRSIRAITDTAIDLHIISPDPLAYLQAIEELKIEYVCLQFEDVGAVPTVPKLAGTRWGISIRTDTPIDILDHAQGYDYVMLMCTTPGASGGVFQRDNLKRIVEIKHRYPHLQIQVDGGVNDEVAFILRLLGVDCIVSGSYIMNHSSIGAGMLSLYRAPATDSFQVRDFMTPVQYLPVLEIDRLSFRQILETIDQFKMGFVLITDHQKQLIGLISNADLRRGLIRQLDHLDDIDVAQMINFHPIRIDPSASLGALIKMIHELTFIILFLPVVDDSGRLHGAVMLNTLARG